MFLSDFRYKCVKYWVLQTVVRSLQAPVSTSCGTKIVKGQLSTHPDIIHELSLYSLAGLFEFMPHVVTTRHDLLINHVFTIQFITIVPKYCSHCCGHCTCEEMASHKGSMQTPSESEPEPCWSAVSVRLTHHVSRPPAPPTGRESVWSKGFHHVSSRLGFGGAVQDLFGFFCASCVFVNVSVCVAC